MKTFNIIRIENIKFSKTMMYDSKYNKDIFNQEISKILTKKKMNHNFN